MKQIIVLIIIVVGVFGFFLFNFFKKSPVSLNQENSLPLKIDLKTAKNAYRVSSGKIPEIPFVLPSGYQIHLFAGNLGYARDLEFSPGGALLVSNPNAGEVYALEDKGNLTAEKKTIISGENRPHGLAFYQGKLYVAEVDKVVRYNWDESKLEASKDKVLFSLPQNNDHNSRSIVFDSAGKMYVSVGSTCNVCIESSTFSATVIVSDPEGNNVSVFAKGLRNAPFLQINPKTSEIWGTEMGRDNLGDNIPPDEINTVKAGGDYGWPFCFGQKIHDDSFDSLKKHSCITTQPPLFEIPAHSAPLGLVFINSEQFPQNMQGDLLVAYHGSWNRSSPIGYKVVHLKVSQNSISASDDFLTGFLPDSALVGPLNALGRPVDLIFDKQGNLYLSDDKAGNVYIIQKS